MRFTEQFKREQREMLKVARDFGYAEHYIDRLKNAQSLQEMDRIMIDARKDKWND